jgi:hypothetical protein
MVTRETAIRLLDNRIKRELEKLSPLATKLDKPEKYSGEREQNLYNLLRKQILIARLIRWETALIQLGPSSPDLALVAFGRYVDGIEILTGQRATRYSVVTLQEYQGIGQQLIFPSEKKRNSARCFDDFHALQIEYKTLFWKHIYYNLFRFMNNAVSKAGTNRSVVLSLSRNRPSFANTIRLFWGIRDDMIKQLDRWADDVVVLAGWIPCLEADGLKSLIQPMDPSYFLESAGSYFEMKGYNFGVPSEDEPIFDAPARIVASCKAIDILGKAKDTRKNEQPAPELDEFLLDLKEFDYKQDIDDRISKLKT